MHEKIKIAHYSTDCMSFDVAFFLELISKMDLCGNWFLDLQNSDSMVYYKFYLDKIDFKKSVPNGCLSTRNKTEM